MSWAVGLSSAAIRTLDQLPVRVVPAVVEFVLYEINDIDHSITVVRVTSRADANRPR